MWRRWREGQSLSEIGRALGRGAGSIHGTIKLQGGFSPDERTKATTSALYSSLNFRRSRRAIWTSSAGLFPTSWWSVLSGHAHPWCCGDCDGPSVNRQVGCLGSSYAIHGGLRAI
jgi:hypothetical protein